MEENRRKALEDQLRKMIDNTSRENEVKEKPRTRTGNGNVIRRRAGEKDKRFSTRNR